MLVGCTPRCGPSTRPTSRPDSLDTWKPPIPDDFGIWLTALTGPDGDVGEEIFGVTACSPKWLARATVTDNTKGFGFVRHRLVVRRWDADLFRRAIGDLCQHTSGSDWPEVAANLSHYLAWEFEDYTPQ